MANNHSSYFQARKAGGGGVYVPPDFEPHFRPNIFVPTDAHDEHDVTPKGGHKVTTAHISQYETLSESSPFGDTEFVGEHTTAYAVGGMRRTFNGTGPYVPPDDSITEQVEDQYTDRSVSCFKHVDTGVVKTGQPSEAVTSITNLNLPVIHSFRGPDLIITGHTANADLDDSSGYTLSTAPPVIHARQPSWPPTFGKRDAEAHNEELPRVSEPPAQVPVLPVSSMVSSDGSCKLQMSQSAFSDAKSTSPPHSTDHQDHASMMQPVATSPPKLRKREKLSKLFGKISGYLHRS